MFFLKQAEQLLRNLVTLGARYGIRSQAKLCPRPSQHLLQASIGNGRNSEREFVCMFKGFRVQCGPPLHTLKDSLYKSKLHEGLMDYPLSSSSLFISTESCSSGFEPDLTLSRTCWYILRSSSSLMISFSLSTLTSSPRIALDRT